MSTINVTNLSGRGGATPNLPDGANITGVATATTFDGSLKTTGTPTLGLGVTINSSGLHVTGVTTVGVVTGGTFYGDGSNLTGVGESISPWNYNPDVNDTAVTVDTGIGITFNKKVVAGSGTATLKIVNAGAAGTTIQSWGVSSCTFATQQFTLGALVSSLTINQTYQVDIPGTFIDDTAEKSYVGTAWTFAVQDAEVKYLNFGYNPKGELAQNNRTNYSSPVQVPGNTWDLSQQFYAAEGNASTKTDGTLWSWGNNGYGGLGDNTVINRSSPVQVPGTTWNTVYAGDQTLLATKTDGTLWSCGLNNAGQLGQGNGTYYSSPVQIPGTSWALGSDKIHGPYRANAAIRTNGTLWTWGEDDHGELAHNNNTNYSSPKQVGTDTTWSKISFGKYNGHAIKTDGTLWGWGRNAYGCLGQNQAEAQLGKVSSPVQVPGTNWSTIAAGFDFALATKTDGTAWAWGLNERGQLGHNNKTEYSSPVQVPGTTWSKFAAGYNHSIAVKTDGTAWTWGYNEYGQLGQNNVTQYSSPVQVGAETIYTDCTSSRYRQGLLLNDQTP